MNCFYITHYMNKQYQTGINQHPSNIVLYSDTKIKKLILISILQSHNLFQNKQAVKITTKCFFICLTNN